MKGYFSTGQSPQWAVVPMEEEEGRAKDLSAPRYYEFDKLAGDAIRHRTKCHLAIHCMINKLVYCPFFTQITHLTFSPSKCYIIGYKLL